MSRKRRLSGCDDEPLSKRINNLHINNAILHHSKSLRGSQMEELLGPGVMAPNNLDLSDFSDLPSLSSDESQSSCSLSASLHHQHYRPDLGPTDNPMYYEPNRLLFELHHARLQRSGLQPP